MNLRSRFMTAHAVSSLETETIQQNAALNACGTDWDTYCKICVLVFAD
jgi:hypothetical protein